MLDISLCHGVTIPNYEETIEEEWDISLASKGLKRDICKIVATPQALQTRIELHESDVTILRSKYYNYA